MKQQQKTKLMTISVPISLHTHLKLVAKEQNKTISKLLTEKFYTNAT